MKPYREKLGLFVEKHVLPWKFELGVLVVALILGTFVVASYAHATPGYGPPDPEAYLERLSELGPDVKPCSIDLATGENCFGEVVGARSDDGNTQHMTSEAGAYANNVAHPDERWGVNAAVPAEAWNQLAPEDVQHFMTRAATDPYGALQEIFQKMGIEPEEQQCVWYIQVGNISVMVESACENDMMSVSAGASMTGFGMSGRGTRRVSAEYSGPPVVVPDMEPCTMWRPVVMFSKPPEGWVPYKGGYTHPDCVPLEVHIPPLSPHNHLPCSDSVSAGASRLDVDRDEDEEEVYDLDCGKPRVKLEQQGDPRDVLHTELRRMGYHVFQDSQGVWYTAKTDMYVGGKVVTCVGPIDSSETDCREWVAINDKDRLRACTIHGNVDTSCLSRTVIYDRMMMERWINGEDPVDKEYTAKDWIGLVLLAIVFGLLGRVIVDRLSGKGKANIGE